MKLKNQRKTLSQRPVFFPLDEPGKSSSLSAFSPARLQGTKIDSDMSPTFEKQSSYRRKTQTVCQQTKFDLGTCILNIESILCVPDAVKILSKNQVEAIKNLKEKIIDNLQASSEAVKDGSTALLPKGVADNMEGVENKFIASTFGGVKSIKGQGRSGRRVQTILGARLPPPTATKTIISTISEESITEEVVETRIKPVERRINLRTKSSVRFNRLALLSTNNEDSDDSVEEVRMNRRTFIDTNNEDSDDSVEEDSCFVDGKKPYIPLEWKKLRMEQKQRLFKLLCLENLARWDFDMTEIADETESDGVCNPLFMIGWAILGAPSSQKAMAYSLGRRHEPNGQAAYNFGECDSVKLNQETLCRFLRAVEKEYVHTNPYHNNIHAADVVQTTHALIQMGGKKLLENFSIHDAFSMLLAAVVHDVGHPGRNNLYQVNAVTDFAIETNNVSVLENHHASKAFQMMMGSNKVEGIDVLEGLEKEDKILVRKRMIQVILGTDMSQHFSHFSNIQGLASNMEENGITLPDLCDHQTDEEEKKFYELLSFIVHLADISNPTKPTPIAEYWADSALAEFFQQGDAEKDQGLPVSPLCDRETTNRASSQRGFILFVVLPAFELMGTIIPAVKDIVLPIVRRNVAFWEKIIEEEKEGGK